VGIESSVHNDHSRSAFGNKVPYIRYYITDSTFIYGPPWRPPNVRLLLWFALVTVG